MSFPVYIISMKRLVKPLLAWYAANHRVLPWRSDPQPYHVWLSEIMLQQTRVDTVIPYYERFLKELPTVQDLAAVPEERLLKLWEGLGYYSRARNLQKAARMIGEKFPDTYAELRKLPGVGEYTAGAIASIAFGLPEPAVDGNVLRILTRVNGIFRDITEPKLKEEFREALRKVYPPENCGDFTQALMELGATVCLPNGEPDCLLCPWREFCYTAKNNCWQDIPVKKASKPRKVEKRIVLIALCNGKTALHRRPGKGLLANLWEFPNVLEGETLPFTGDEYLKLEAKHIFSHIEWHMTGIFVNIPEETKDFEWVKIADLQEKYALPSAFNVFRKQLLKG